MADDGVTADRHGDLALKVAQVLTLLLAIVALTAALTRSDVQASRQHAAMDSCRLFRGLVLAAAPQHKLAAAKAYIAATPLRDCTSYGLSVTRK